MLKLLILYLLSNVWILSEPNTEIKIEHWINLSNSQVQTVYTSSHFVFQYGYVQYDISLKINQNMSLENYNYFQNILKNGKKVNLYLNNFQYTKVDFYPNKNIILEADVKEYKEK